MQPEFEPFDALTDRLRADLTPVRLADAAGVRRQGERRTRNQLTVTVLGVAALVVAMIGGGWMVAAGTGSPYQPASRPAATEVSVDPTTAGPPTPTTSATEAAPTTRPPKPTTKATTPPAAVPTGPNRMLPLLRSSIGPVQREYFAPPRPCGPGAARPSDRDVTWSIQAQGQVRHESASGQAVPDVAIAYVGVYRAGGAAAYLAELKADVAACPGTIGDGQSYNTLRWSIVDEGFAGPGSLLLKLRGGANGYFDEKNMGEVYIGAARVGNTVVTLTDLGWEGLNGTEALTRSVLAEFIALQK